MNFELLIAIKQILMLINLVLHGPLCIKSGLIFSNSALLWSIHFLYNSYNKQKVYIYTVQHQWFW